MRIIRLLVLLLIFSSCRETKKNDALERVLKNEIMPNKVLNADLEVYDFNEFQKLLQKKDDKVYVVNFWATWCAPCITELPYFEKLHSDYKDKNVEVILVSLDFPHLYDSKLKPFIINKKLHAKVIALNDEDMTSWIPKVNENWSGSIPATIIYKNDTSKFYEHSFTYDALETEVKQFLN